MPALLTFLFWASSITVFYVYVGFPLCLWIVTRGRSLPQAPSNVPDTALPSIALVVAALNEEEVIEEKLKNSLALDYPPEKLTLLFVSDGSTDGTNEILRRYQSDRVKVVILPVRGGKMQALKTAFPLCKEEILVLSDANTLYRPDALRKLVRHFADPSVGVSTGDVRIRTSDAAFGHGEGAYYRYEKALYQRETALWSMIGVDGAMYAIRRSLVVAPSSNIILDDFVISMNAARQGYRIVYDPEAIAEEDPTPGTSLEFGRKVRIVSGGFQALFQKEGLPRFGQGRLMWMYGSHKLLRWLVPVLLLTALISSMILAAVQHGFWIWIAALQGLFYAAALAGSNNSMLLLRIPFYFGMVNLAAFLGLIRALRRRESVLWKKGARGVVSQPQGRAM